MAEKKTPSARVIAAQWILNQLDADDRAPTLHPEVLTELFESRVNEKKADKVREQIEKLAGKFVERMQKIVDKFNVPSKKG